MNAELKKETGSPKIKRSTNDSSFSEKSKKDNSNSNSKIESSDVKVVNIENSKLLKAYYWKKEKVTFLAVGCIGIEKRAGDQTKQLQEEYKKMGTDQMLKIIAAMVEAQNQTKK